MQSPFVVGVASIVPGLGFVLLNKIRWAFNAFVMVFGLFLAGLFVASEFWGELFAQFSILAWIGQIYYAVQTAKRERKRALGQLDSVRDVPLISIPSALSHGDKLAYRSAETIRAQLLPGEVLKDAVFALIQPSMGQHMLLGIASMLSMKQYHIGLTNKHLVLLELDLLAKPSNFTRIQIDSLEAITYNKGTLNDRFIITLAGKEVMNFQVGFWFRKHTENMYNLIEI